MRARAPKTPGRLTPADVVVLAMLAARPTHGYDLVAALSRRAEGEGAAVSRAQIYYSLKKLLRLGLIAAVKDGAPAAGPEREPYRLSPSGRRAMSRAIARPEWACERPPIPFQTWLIVLGEAEPADRAAALRSRREHLARQIESESRAVERLRGKNDPGDSMKLAVAAHAVEVLRLEHQLLADVEPMLGRTASR